MEKLAMSVSDKQRNYFLKPNSSGRRPRKGSKFLFLNSASNFESESPYIVSYDLLVIVATFRIRNCTANPFTLIFRYNGRLMTDIAWFKSWYLGALQKFGYRLRASPIQLCAGSQ
jgi:hypothetical protein